MSIKDITIVITSFKSENKIRKCLNSIDKQYNVINVENSSDQDYKTQIEKEFENVKCILSGENIGYGKGNNIGLKEVKTKYALILNPDAELFPDSITNFFNNLDFQPGLSTKNSIIVYDIAKIVISILQMDTNTSVDEVVMNPIIKSVIKK